MHERCALKIGQVVRIVIITDSIRSAEKPSSSLSARRFCGGAVRLQGQSIGPEPAPPRCSASTALPLAAPQKWGNPPASSECGSSRRPSPSLAPRDRFCGTAGARAAPPGRRVPRWRLVLFYQSNVGYAYQAIHRQYAVVGKQTCARRSFCQNLKFRISCRLPP